MADDSKNKGECASFLAAAAVIGWIIPGGGYYLIGEKKRAIIIFITVLLTFLTGLYIGSIGVIDPVGSWPWYIAQVLFSPAVFILGYHTSGGGYPAYGWANDIGQIYTSIAGLLNLLCIVNALHLGYRKYLQKNED